MRLILASCALLVSAFVAGASASSQSAARGGATCAAYYVIDSRGSGEPQGKASPPGSEFFQTFEDAVAPKKVKLLVNGYPARGNFALLGAALHVPGAYHDSVRGGVTWLSDELPKIHTLCPSAKVVLTGYSQGAQVSADVIQRNGDFPYVLAVVLFGDPYFNSRDARVDRGDFRIGPKGGLGSRPKFTGGHVRSYCHANDPVCQFGSNPIAKLTFHNNYDKLLEPQEAARWVAGLDRSAKAATLATFAGAWYGHTRSLVITGNGRATEVIGSGCCDPVIDLHLQLSGPAGTMSNASVTATVTAVIVRDPKFYPPGNPPPRVGQSAKLTLKNGEIVEPITNTNYCNNAAGAKGLCGA